MLTISEKKKMNAIKNSTTIPYEHTIFKTVSNLFLLSSPLLNRTFPLSCCYTGLDFCDYV